MTDSAERRRSAGRRFFAVAAVALSVVFAATCPSCGTVCFTGLDDSAQCVLARAFRDGAPLRWKDFDFAAVPERARPHLLYRAAAHRLTRDLAWQISPDSFEARPFFQPFLPLQRAFLPGLPVLLALLSLALAWRAGGFLCAIACVGAFLATPWPARFCFGPFAEGPAALFCATALALVFWAASSGRGASDGELRRMPAFFSGLLLGLGVTFHPTLAACAVPVAAFAAFIAADAAALALLALGSAAGLAPLALSTAFVTAPYGNFLNPSTLRAMLAGSADIRALGVALAAMAPATVLLAVATRSAKLRAVTKKTAFRDAVAVCAAVLVAAAVAAAIRVPGARRALEADIDALGPALPAIGATLALAIAARKPAGCALLAGIVLSALPFLAIQGNETNVGIWSLRRSMPPALLVPFAAALALFARRNGESRKAKVEGQSGVEEKLRIAAAAMLAATAAFQIARHPAAYSTGAERGAGQLVEALDARLPDGSICVFERIHLAAPLASDVGGTRPIFGLGDGTVNGLEHAPVVDWLVSECARRPVFVVAARDVAAPIFDDGLALIPTGDSIRGETRRVAGRTFGTAAENRETRTFAVLSARPASSSEARNAFAAAGAAVFPGEPSPFGLAPGAWAPPKRGKSGRWACDGAEFFGPAAPPDCAIEIEVRASWWTSARTNAPTQRLWLECVGEGDGGGPVLRTKALELEPSPEPGLLRWIVPTPPPTRTGTYRWRLRAETPGSERGWPENLAACVESIRFRALRNAVPVPAPQVPGPCFPKTAPSSSAPQARGPDFPKPAHFRECKIFSGNLRACVR